MRMILWYYEIIAVERHYGILLLLGRAMRERPEVHYLRRKNSKTDRTGKELKEIESVLDEAVAAALALSDLLEKLCHEKHDPTKLDSVKRAPEGSDVRFANKELPCVMTLY